ncbi:EAL domain-containing protein [Burkholderia pseudomallei]|uniref:EAL domain-containing protein n=1 Tax=Burkholderia pseudomallei TaxID=28450 RepID=UPI0029495314|nr:EAL domain-containing protein [Burkholderia pseudomallei]CAJ9540750.1 diguanylate phosphodiesterase [Burkholderia pseudomallei]
MPLLGKLFREGGLLLDSGWFMQEPANSLGGRLSGADNGEFAERVRRGLRAREFRVVFQPILHAPSRTISCVECLLRWDHPQFGLLNAGAFNDVFRDHQTALDAFRFVLAVACEEIVGAKIVMPHQLLPRIAINIPASLLLREEFGGEIAETAACYGIDAGFLDLEIVETEDVSKFLSLDAFTKPLRDRGIRLFCDDFGIAHPPFVALGLMQIDGLKIDKMFLKCIPDSSRAATVLENLLGLCSKLQLDVVVEGVENEAQFKWLSAYGSVGQQGMYIGKAESNIEKAMSIDLRWR